MTSLKEQSTAQSIPKVGGKNFTAAHVGKFADLAQYSLTHPRMQRTVAGKLFIKDHLALTSMQVSLNKLPAGAGMPFYHSHKNDEELYIFVGGKGQFQVDGETIDVEEGTVIRVATPGVRAWRNNSTEDLFYIVIQAKEGSLEADTFDDGVPHEQPVTW